MASLVLGTKKQLKGSGLVLAPFWRVESIVVGESQWQEGEIDGHLCL